MGTLIDYKRLLGIDQDGKLIIEEKGEKVLSSYKIEIEKIMEKCRKRYPNVSLYACCGDLFDALIIANSKCDVDRILVEYDRKYSDDEEHHQNKKTSFWQKLFGH